MLNHAVGKSLVQNRFLDIVRELCKIKQGSANLQVCAHTVRETEISYQQILTLITDCDCIVLLERNRSAN